MSFTLALFTVNVLAVVAANVQVFRARHITTEFSESRYIAISMLVTLQGAVLAAPLFFYPIDPDAAYAGRTILTLITAASILYLIFIPKIMFWRKREEILKEREDNRRKRLSVLPPGSLAQEFFGNHGSGSGADSSGGKESSPASSPDRPVLLPRSADDCTSGLRVASSSRFSSVSLHESSESRASLPADDVSAKESESGKSNTVEDSDAMND